MRRARRTDSRELKAALTKAESSLRSLEASFASYRQEAENQIDRLERAGFFSRIAAVVARYALLLDGRLFWPFCYFEEGRRRSWPKLELRARESPACARRIR